MLEPVAVSGGKLMSVPPVKNNFADSGSSVTCLAEGDGFRYVGHFKGGIYRYDTGKDTSELIYHPIDQYIWPEDLKLDDDFLTARLVNREIVRYDIKNRTIKFNVAK